jgi:hypothetical protein
LSMLSASIGLKIGSLKPGESDCMSHELTTNKYQIVKTRNLHDLFTTYRNRELYAGSCTPRNTINPKQRRCHRLARSCLQSLDYEPL